MDGSDVIRRNRASWNRGSDAYQAAHAEQLARPLVWGVFAIPEAEVGALGEIAGRDVLELGCGAAQWSIALAQRGARPIGLDFSERQLAHAQRLMRRAGVVFPLVHASAERAPLRDASFDVVFCDHGAMSWARPEHTVAEAARLLRPAGRLVFNMASPLHDVCWLQAQDKVTPKLARDYFELGAIDEENDATSFQLPYGAWIRLFRRHALRVEDLIELRPPPDARTSYPDFVPLEWARRWPAENLWVLSRAET